MYTNMKSKKLRAQESPMLLCTMKSLSTSTTDQCMYVHVRMWWRERGGSGSPQYWPDTEEWWLHGNNHSRPARVEHYTYSYSTPMYIVDIYNAQYTCNYLYTYTTILHMYVIVT